MNLRMWMIDPVLMCDKHLKNEDMDIHLFLKFLKNDINIDDLYDKQYLFIDLIKVRHDEIVDHFNIRRIEHDTPLDWNKLNHIYKIQNKKRFKYDGYTTQFINSMLYNNMVEISNMCHVCKQLMGGFFST